MTKLQSRSILVGVLLLASLGLMGLNQTGRLREVKGILLVPLTAIQRGVAVTANGIARLFQDNPDLDALRQRNAELEAQVAHLQARVIELEEQEADRRVLAALLDYARSRPEDRYLAANVVGRDSSPFLSYLFLDLGSDAGIARDMPVVTDKGLVGRIVEVNCCASKVLLITDPASAVNARLQKSRDEGIAVGLLAGGLELQYLSQRAEVKPGDLVITSGLGGTFPEGIAIGTVSAVQRQDYEVLQKANLTPGADFGRLEIVLIITNFKPVDFAPFFQATPTPVAPAP